MTDFSNKFSILHDFFGHSAFREGQENIIDSILSSSDTLGIMPTGAGKSMCYQIPALMFDGITVVVSPLISLMKDQVNSLIQSGIRAAYLNSSLTSAQYETAVANAKKGTYKIIYVAPERLCTASFLSLARYVKISMLTVDEAHCVSQWGQDFRPSYLKIPEFLSQLPYRPIVSAFTATATAQVRDDIIKMLGLRNPFCLTTGFDRENLYFGVIHPKDKYAQTKALVKENADKFGIIYCSTRKNVESVCEKLRNDGFRATRYHAGLSDEERRKNQDDFIYDRVQVIVATNAFGMGIDKSNVSYVIHYNMPKNIESYYQEAGRAGRDGNEAKCILLYSGQDVVTNRFLIENSNDNPELDDSELELIRKKDLHRLKIMTDYCNTDKCLREFILNYFGENKVCTCGNCSNCSGEFEEQDITVESQKILSCIYRLYQRNLKFGGTVISQILRGADNARIKQFRLSELSTYGIMKDSTDVRIRQIIRHLNTNNYICEGDHQTLCLTRKSAEILMEKKTLTMRLPKKTEPSKQTVRKSDSKGEISIFDKVLFDRLRKLRAKIAAEISMPAYIVFSDASLRDMCIKLPKNQTEMLEVSGVGKAKQQRYGKYFVAEILEYLKSVPSAEKQSALPEEYLKFNENDNRTRLLKILLAGADRLESSEEEMSLTQLCDRTLTQLGVTGDKNVIYDAFKNWLLNENYLTEQIINGRKQTRTTILSEEAGIYEAEKISSLGNTYTAVIYPKAAQDFLYANINEITEQALIRGLQ